MRRIIGVFLLLALLLAGCDRAPQTSLPPEAEGRTVITMGILFAYANELSPCYRIANAFNAAQDEIWVEVKTYIDVDNYSTLDDAKSKMNAQLSAGDRADIYEMISIDAQAMRHAGFLADWYPLMEADPTFRKEDYFTNIWELLETDGKLYQMCVAFDLYGVNVPHEYYTGQDGWTLAEFADYVSEHQLSIGSEDLLNMMLFYGCQFEFVDAASGTCHFDDPAFLELLAYLQQLPSNTSNERDIFAGHIMNPNSHETIHRLDGYYRRVMGLPTQRRTGPGVSIRNSYGLSSETEHPEACWALIRWLLAYDQQLMDSTGGVNPVLSTGIPLHRDAWERQLYRAGLDGHHEDSLFYRHSYGDKVYPEAIYPAMPQEEIDYLREAVASADYVSLGFFDYEDITSIVEEEVLVFLAGDRTAEECARIIQSRVSTFLAERS